MKFDESILDYAKEYTLEELNEALEIKKQTISNAEKSLEFHKELLRILENIHKEKLAL